MRLLNDFISNVVLPTNVTPRDVILDVILTDVILTDVILVDVILTDALLHHFAINDVQDIEVMLNIVMLRSQG